MLPRLQRILRPILFVRPGLTLGRASENSTATARKPLSMMFLQSCDLGTHPHKEPMEPLNSPRGARDFIYSLHPTERTCLLRELHRFESIAIAQGKWFWCNWLTSCSRHINDVTVLSPTWGDRCSRQGNRGICELWWYAGMRFWLPPITV